MVSSVGNSQTGLSPSSQHNQLIGMPGYDPNRIPSSVFSSKLSNPVEWSLASNESLFSIHMSNISFSGEQALAALLRSSEKLKRDGSVNQKTDANPVIPSVKEPERLEKKPETVKNPEQEEESDSESDDEETKEKGGEGIQPHSDDEPKIVAQTKKQEEEE
ncbi:PREDICTED: uncharacterized protein LOC104803131, partial [Tarenaya hassleriana]|uniref:uncharacterized protein LOC104803131 n=1 Tax=Tarenaya hassleriana TaxID=28532 RepID=UPI00053C0818